MAKIYKRGLIYTSTKIVVSVFSSWLNSTHVAYYKRSTHEAYHKRDISPTTEYTDYMYLFILNLAYIFFAMYVDL